MFQPGKYYHLYNHANGFENIFKTEDNYRFFLQKYASYLNPIADTYCYCLMPNHFHFLIKIREVDEWHFINNDEVSTKQIIVNPEKKISQQLSNLFNSYAKSYNKAYQRKGSLFIQNIKKKEIISTEYFTNLIHYIHNNPVHHGFVTKIEDWNWSSYATLINNSNSPLKINETLNWFIDKNSFVDFHKHPCHTVTPIEFE
jgi:REP element-mobilizing transposase RayT